jgi:hypothetical protein
MPATERDVHRSGRPRQTGRLADLGLGSGGDLSQQEGSTPARVMAPSCYLAPKKRCVKDVHAGAGLCRGVNHQTTGPA